MVRAGRGIALQEPAAIQFQAFLSVGLALRMMRPLDPAWLPC
ncbi:hypothetical protein CLOSTMETH_00444 [[Clostridium] methylpentosum DSM 5476]|uniref:Uncharacterized protein n=1 Tax=[Clostridium] methylpentosum DSM 5476 TaxID=537013 RepID=C0E9E6_9FIRM|nr:hypothetical protein CLOSTMETH_00444 [[Clostridium] methylpentosum DSM 5476]